MKVTNEDYQKHKPLLFSLGYRMMEHLVPDERAVLLLREVFDFSYLEIANIIEKKVGNCGKISLQFEE